MVQFSSYQALEKLLERNQNYVSGQSSCFQGVTKQERKKLVQGQLPYAAILGCADSRVVPEFVFDAVPGELFVCRNAGNLVDENVLSSIEYAVNHLGCALICVMGHSSCGAIKAAVNHSRFKDLEQAKESFHVLKLAKRIGCHLELPGKERTIDAEVVDSTARKNVEHNCVQFMLQSPTISKMVKSRVIGLVGLWHELESGKIDVITQLT